MMLEAEVGNVFVIFLGFSLFAWILRLCQHIVSLSQLSAALFHQSVVRFDGFSEEFGEVPLFSRGQFEQLMRSRQVTPAVSMATVALPLQIARPSLKSVHAKASSGTELLGVSFQFDASVPCTLQCFWGVNAASFHKDVAAIQSTVDHATAMLYSPKIAKGKAGHAEVDKEKEKGKDKRSAPRSRPGTPAPVASSIAVASLSELFPSLAAAGAILPEPAVTCSAGSKQIFSASAAPGGFLDCAATGAAVALEFKGLEPTPIDPPHGLGLGLDDSPASDLKPVPAPNPTTEPAAPAQYPLVIVMCANEAPQKQGVTSALYAKYLFTLCTFSSSKPEEASPSVLKQFLLTSTGSIQQIHEIFGLEDPENAECVVCLSEKKQITLLPCRHCCVCEECFQHLDKCPVCRSMIGSYLRLSSPAAAPPVIAASPTTSLDAGAGATTTLSTTESAV